MAKEITTPRLVFAVANPPFSDKAWTNGLTPENDAYSRFEYGVPPCEGQFENQRKTVFQPERSVGFIEILDILHPFGYNTLSIEPRY